MSTKNKMKIEGGSGGKRGHSGMEHWEETEIIKAKTKRLRRQDGKKKIREWEKEDE